MKLSNLIIAASCIITGTNGFQPGFGMKQQKLSSSLAASKNNNSEDDRRSFMEKVLLSSATAATAALPGIANANSQAAFQTPAQREKARVLAEANEKLAEGKRMLNANYRKGKEAGMREELEQKKLEEAERNKEENARLAEEKRIEALREKNPPEKPRVLVLGATNGIGKEVKKLLEAEGVFVVATSRTGKDGSIALDVTENYAKVPDVVQKIATENKISAVVSCIPPGIGTDKVGLLAGCAGQIASGAKQAQMVRNFVAIGPSPTVKATPPVGLETYIKAAAIAEGIIKYNFGSGKDGYSYTLLSPGAIGKDKNFGKDKAVPSNVLAEAMTVGATAFYLGLSSLEADSIEKITELAGSVGKVKDIKPYVPV